MTGGTVPYAPAENQTPMSYDGIYRTSRWAVPEYFNFARDVLDRRTHEDDKLALWWIDEEGKEVKKAFSQLCRDSRKAGNVLASQGVRRGEVVIVVLRGRVTSGLGKLR